MLCSLEITEELSEGIRWCYDTGLHVPMIIKWPKSYPAPANYMPSAVKDEVVSLIDLTPTTLGFAGIDKPYGMHGRIFLVIRSVEEPIVFRPRPG